jgi:hypothetical protein
MRETAFSGPVTGGLAQAENRTEMNISATNLFIPWTLDP